MPARRELPGLVLLLTALAFGAIFLFPEIQIGQLPLNDNVFHLTAAERRADATTHDEPFLDPWVSEWSFGFPVWRSYQPLPHLAAAAVLSVSRDKPAAFALLHYLLLVLFPASLYLGARLFGLRPIAAGLASLLALAPSGSDELGRFGLGLGATVWRGTGLYTQLFALHLLVLTIGFVTRALDEGRHRIVASLLFALTALSHIIFAYVVLLSAGLLVLAGPPNERARRAIRGATVVLPALLLVAWFMVPLALSLGDIANSRWEDAYKWDSFGAPIILRALFTGQLLDAERLPVLTLLVAGGVIVAALRRELVARRLLVLTSFWLILFFGRATWGHLTWLVGVLPDFHLHRLQGAFELFAVLLAAHGVETTIRWLFEKNRSLAVAAIVLVVGALVPIAVERAQFLRLNEEWGRSSVAEWNRERGDLEAALGDVRAILRERPGRVSAGLSNQWGRDFKIGAIPIYAFLSRAHFDQASMLYHAMSPAARSMVMRNDFDPSQNRVFGIRVLVAPIDRTIPPIFRQTSKHGRFAVYEVSPEGYFGVVELAGRYAGPQPSRSELSEIWMRSHLPSQNRVILFDSRGPDLPSIERWAPLPDLLPVAPAGQVLNEDKIGETYHARLSLLRPAYAYVKITWFPDLIATVDGVVTQMLRVTPGFGAVPVAAGIHEVVVTYRPGILKPFLFFSGIALFCGFWLGFRRRPPPEERWAARLASVGERLVSPGATTFLLVAALFVVAVHGLFQGALVDGRDSTTYPPQLVEMNRALRDGQIPPVWAPDFANGHGQPWLEFQPPLIHLAAVPFYAMGTGTADALQLAMALLLALGTVAIYRLARRISTARTTAIAMTAMFVFSPQLTGALFERGAFVLVTGIAVAPIALLGLICALDEPSASRILLGAIAVALVPIADEQLALLFLPMLTVVVMAKTLQSDQRGPTIWAGSAVLAAGLALSAFFWLPALFERNLITAPLVHREFVEVEALFFGLGPLHLLIGTAGVALAIRARMERALTLSWAVVALVGVALATTFAVPDWLALPALFLPLAGISLLNRLAERYRVVAVVALVLTGLWRTEPHRYLHYDDEYYTPQRIASLGIAASQAEYDPRSVTERPAYRAQALIPRDAGLRVLSQDLRSQRQSFVVKADAATRVDTSTFYFPRWQVTVDGTGTAAEVDPRSGLIGFHLPAGEHTIVLQLGRTPLRWVALLTSAASGLALIICWCFAWRRRVRRPS